MAPARVRGNHTKLELDAETFAFNGLAVDGEALAAALQDPNHFYRFVNDGQTITIEKYDIKSIENLIHE